MACTSCKILIIIVNSENQFLPFVGLVSQIESYLWFNCLSNILSKKESFIMGKLTAKYHENINHIKYDKTFSMYIWTVKNGLYGQ